MQDELLSEGLTLMLAGMGTVFVFLTTLVIVMTLMAKVVTRFLPASETTGDDADVIAAISAAIAQHRNKQ